MTTAARATADKEEVRLIEEWATLDTATRRRRWDLLDRNRRKVLTDAFGTADLFGQPGKRRT